MTVEIDTTVFESAISNYASNPYIWGWHVGIAVVVFLVILIGGMVRRFDYKTLQLPPFFVDWPFPAFMIGWIWLSIVTALLWPVILFFAPIIAVILRNAFNEKRH